MYEVDSIESHSTQAFANKSNQICEYCPFVGPALLDVGDDCNLCCCTRKCGMRGLCMVVLAEIPRIRGAAACGPCTAPTAQVGMTLLCASVARAPSPFQYPFSRSRTRTHTPTIDRYFSVSPLLSHTHFLLVSLLPFLFSVHLSVLLSRFVPRAGALYLPIPARPFLARALSCSCAGSDTHNHWFCTSPPLSLALSPSIILALAPSVNFCCCPVSSSSVLSPSFAMLRPPLPRSLSRALSLALARCLSLPLPPSRVLFSFSSYSLHVLVFSLATSSLSLALTFSLSRSLSLSLARLLSVPVATSLARWLSPSVTQCYDIGPGSL